MKVWAINTILLLSACSAAFLFCVKFDKPEGPDMFQYGLAGIEKYLSPGSRIVLEWDIPGVVNDSAFINYFLAPARLAPFATEKNDTILRILPTSVSDPGLITSIRKSVIIWQKSDYACQYMLTCPRRSLESK